MLRYMVLAWNCRLPQQCSSASTLIHTLSAHSCTWRSALALPGLAVLCTAERGSLLARGLPDQTGVLLGCLFLRNTDPTSDVASCIGALDTAWSQRAMRSHGQSVVRENWGNYVLVLRDPTSAAIHVVKDPCGELPCFMTTLRGVTLFFSDINDCLLLGSRFTINDVYLHHRLISGGMNQLHSPLHGVSMVGRGECVSIQYTATSVSIGRQRIWHPLQFARTSSPIDDASYAANGLHGSVISSARAWASLHERVLVRLSGGLDSSIILGCLSREPQTPRLTSYTYWDAQGRADERPWARLAAQRAHCPHIECVLDPTEPGLNELPPLRASIHPPALQAYLHRVRVEKQLIFDTSATAVFTGLGGDSGLCSDSSALSLIEHLQRHGPGRHSLVLASQIALSCELSTWQVLWRSIRRWLRGSRMMNEQHAQLSACQMVNAELVRSAGNEAHFPHPWFAALSDIPWSCTRRLGSLMYPPDFYDLSASNGEFTAEVISPLYAQPAIEFMLQIPLYRHFEDGRDRGLARRAFARELPPEIANRTWKDRAPGFAERIVQRNRDYLRQMLLDGLLVAAGLLDRQAIENALADHPTRSDVYPGELLQHLDTERWARQWSS